MLLITHDPADVEALADEVFELRDGRVRRRDERGIVTATGSLSD